MSVDAAILIHPVYVDRIREGPSCFGTPHSSPFVSWNRGDRGNARRGSAVALGSGQDQLADLLSHIISNENQLRGGSSSSGCTPGKQGEAAEEEGREEEFIHGGRV